MITPRDYQAAAEQSLYDYFAKNTGNPLIAMPTGTGKSVVIASFLFNLYRRYPTQRVMVVTHVKELIAQNFDKLVKLWPMAPAGINSAGLGKRDTEHKIIFAGIGSVYKNAEAFGHIDLLFIDEAHLVSPSDTTRYQAFIAALKIRNPMLKVIGLTATPWRLGHGHIAEGGDGIFTDVCFDLCTTAAFNWLIAEGYLCTLTPKKTGVILDTAGVHKTGGEFNMKQLQDAVNKDKITEAAVQEMIEGAKDRASWLIFAAGVEHAIRTADILNYYGIRTAAIHSKLPEKGKGSRDWLLKAYKAGEFQCATNNNILTTGFDHPSLSFIGCLRPTLSSILWVQLLGRGTRPDYAPGYDLSTKDGRLAAIQASHKHDCLVHDFANNTKRLGPINDPVVPRRKGEGGGGEAPVKVCPACMTWCHATARVCPACAHEFAFTVKIQQEASTIALVKPDMPEVKAFKVDHISVSVHTKLGNPPALRVTYYSNLRHFVEFIGFENPTSRGRAGMWWRERAGPGVPVPATTEEALQLVQGLRQPTHINVWHNKKPYPQIMKYDFTGTAFGAEPVPPAQQPAPPPVQVYASPRVGLAQVAPVQAEEPSPALLDDDIPF